MDFGLATHYNSSATFKSNPKKAHNGTIEYLSRDAHQGGQYIYSQFEKSIYMKKSGLLNMKERKMFQNCFTMINYTFIEVEFAVDPKLLIFKA